MKTILALVLALFCFRSQATEYFPHWSLGSVVQTENGWHFTVTINIVDMFPADQQTLIPGTFHTQEFYLDDKFQGARAFDDADTSLVFTGYIGDALFGQTSFEAGQHIFSTLFGVPNGVAHGSGNFFLETPTGDKPIIQVPPTSPVPDSGSTMLFASLAIGLLFGVHLVRSVRA